MCSVSGCFVQLIRLLPSLCIRDGYSIYCSGMIYFGLVNIMEKELRFYIIRKRLGRLSMRCINDFNDSSRCTTLYNGFASKEYPNSNFPIIIPNNLSRDNGNVVDFYALIVCLYYEVCSHNLYIEKSTSFPCDRA